MHMKREELDWACGIDSGVLVLEIGSSGLWLASMCFQALVATFILIQEADKLTLNQNITIRFPHQVVSLLNGSTS